MQAVAESRWDVSGTVWAVASTVRASQALRGMLQVLCGLSQTLCGLLQPVHMLNMRYVGYCIICIGCCSLYVGYHLRRQGTKTGNEGRERRQETKTGDQDKK